MALEAEKNKFVAGLERGFNGGGIFDMEFAEKIDGKWNENGSRKEIQKFEGHFCLFA
jgi:hypothetical protein